jgi:hypothetical protein
VLVCWSDRAGVPARRLERRREPLGEPVERRVVAVAHRVDGDLVGVVLELGDPRFEVALRTIEHVPALGVPPDPVGDRTGRLGEVAVDRVSSGPELGGEPDRFPLRLPVDVVRQPEAAGPVGVHLDHPCVLAISHQLATATQQRTLLEPERVDRPERERIDRLLGELQLGRCLVGELGVRVTVLAAQRLADGASVALGVGARGRQAGELLRAAVPPRSERNSNPSAVRMTIRRHFARSSPSSSTPSREATSLRSSSTASLATMSASSSSLASHAAIC